MCPYSEWAAGRIGRESWHHGEEVSALLQIHGTVAGIFMKHKMTPVQGRA